MGTEKGGRFTIEQKARVKKKRDPRKKKRRKAKGKRQIYVGYTRDRTGDLSQTAESFVGEDAKRKSYH